MFTPVKGLFPPLPEVQCPISFRYLTSLGKSNGKKWSQIVKLYLKSEQMDGQTDGQTDGHFDLKKASAL